MGSEFQLEGERAVITGGGSGIGLGMAQCMIAAGARVAIIGRRQEALDAAVAELGEQAVGISHDVTDRAAAPDLIAKATEALGGAPTILANNAGNHCKKLAIDTSDDDFDGVIQTHVGAAFSLTRAALPAMLAAGHGNILFTASMTSYLGMPKVIAYSAAKSAYLGMVRALASEVSPQGVRVNGIAPGWIETAMTKAALGSDQERYNKVISRTPMAKMGQPDDIGQAAVYLCSPAAKFVTGVILPIDGGAHMGF